MERFKSIKNSGNRKKTNIATICRCCGLENEDKYEILKENPFSSDGVEFREKFEKLTGLIVKSGDGLPIWICLMCIEKITDFFEFRLMALNTDKQTRLALGLPEFRSNPEKAPSRAPSPTPEIKPLEIRLIDIRYSIEDKALIERALARNNIIQENVQQLAKKRVQSTESQLVPPSKKSKKEASCRICRNTHFSYVNDLNNHLMRDHLPLVAKYACGSCRETFEQLSEHKAHESMHLLKKLPYTCYICCTPYAKPNQFNKHMTNCPLKEKLPVTVGDIKCFQCKKKFLTQNLFEWHACFLRTRGSCSKCGQHFQKKKVLFKHYILCEGLFVTPASARDPNVKVKSEGNRVIEPVKLSASVKTFSKGAKEKTDLNEATSIMKRNIHLAVDTSNDDDYGTMEDITYDNFGNDSDSDSGSMMEPVVEMKEGTCTAFIASVSIKPEKSDSRLAVHEHPTSTAVKEIQKIKSEKDYQPAVTQLQEQSDSRLLLKIKSEQGSNEQLAPHVLNPLALRLEATPKKKIFKMPKDLAMKIKLEKKDRGAISIDRSQDRDEADPEPGEDLMSDCKDGEKILKIKTEKEDNVAVFTGEKVEDELNTKHLINPAAVMMRDKTLELNGNSEKSLVISSVTSIIDSNLGKKGVFDGNQSVVPQALENDQLDRESKVLVHIPEECILAKNADITQHFESNPREKCRVEESEGETVVPIDSLVMDDDFDALLRSYGNDTHAAGVTSNDLLQDLLRLD